MKKKLLIFLRAFLIVLFTTLNVYFISTKLFIGSVLMSGFISLMWTLNVKDLAISDWYDRVSYISGGILGTTISLYVLRDFFIKLF